MGVVLGCEVLRAGMLGICDTFGLVTKKIQNGIAIVPVMVVMCYTDHSDWSLVSAFRKSSKNSIRVGSVIDSDCTLGVLD